MLVKNNVLLPLDDMIAADPDGQAMLDDFVDATTDVFTIDGKLYELPTDCNDAVVHVNTKCFRMQGLKSLMMDGPGMNSEVLQSS